MTKATNEYRTGFDAGVKAKTDDIASNYDSWKRSAEGQGILGSSMFTVADMAVRQVIYGHPLGKAPTNETHDDAEAS